MKIAYLSLLLLHVCLSWMVVPYPSKPDATVSQARVFVQNIPAKHSSDKAVKTKPLRPVKSDQIWLGAGLLSLIFLMAAGMAVGIAIWQLSGFILFTAATALGLVLSKKEKGKGRKFIKSLFVLAVIVNVLAGAYLLRFIGLF